MVNDGRRTELLPHLTRAERKVLWGGNAYVVTLKGMKRSEKHFIRSGDDAAGPFVRIVDPHTKDCKGITSYLHGKTRGTIERALKKGECLCAVQLARNVYDDGSRRLCLDYVIVDEAAVANAAHPIVVKKSADLSGNDTEGMRSVQVVEDNLVLLFGHP